MAGVAMAGVAMAGVASAAPSTIPSPEARRRITTLLHLKKDHPQRNLWHVPNRAEFVVAIGEIRVPRACGAASVL
eukprot:scaffold21601_cov67-Isochrysis_galbana.AAC.1